MRQNTCFLSASLPGLPQHAGDIIIIYYLLSADSVLSIRPGSPGPAHTACSHTAGDMAAQRHRYTASCGLGARDPASLGLLSCPRPRPPSPWASRTPQGEDVFGPGSGCSRGWASNPTGSGTVRSVPSWGGPKRNPCHPWLSPHSCLLVAMADPKTSRDGHVPAPPLLGTPLMLAFFLGEKTRGFCGFREQQDPILEAG